VRRQLAAALADELSGFKTLFDVYQVEAELARLQSGVESRTAEIVEIIPLRGVHFQVFDANASKIGLLPPGLADGVAVAYVLLRALLEEFSRLDELHKQGMAPQYPIKFYQQVISQTQDVRQRIEDLIPGLREYAGLKVINTPGGPPQIDSRPPSAQIGPGEPRLQHRFRRIGTTRLISGAPKSRLRALPPPRLLE
jgi:hypothetical protein